jgi:hypothetical protein
MSQCNFNKCGDKEAPVATFVANILLRLDNADLDEFFLKLSFNHELLKHFFGLLFLSSPKFDPKIEYNLINIFSWMRI